MLLDNLKELKNDMVNQDWTICSFIFRYKGIEYIVLVKRFVGNEKREHQYALVRLHFMKVDDLSDDMQVEANSKGLIVEAKILRKYFGIEYTNNLGDIFQQFTERLGKVIPKNVPEYISDMERTAMVRSLSSSDSEDPNKIFAYYRDKYFSVNVLHIELYTDKKNPDLEEQVETILTEYGIYYNKSEVWIKSERLYEVLYEMEV